MRVENVIEIGCWPRADDDEMVKRRNIIVKEKVKGSGCPGVWFAVRLNDVIVSMNSASEKKKGRQCR